jgi:hypothetical protein
MFEKIIKLVDTAFDSSVIIRVNSIEKNSYQFELDRTIIDDKYQDTIDSPEQVSAYDYVELFKQFGYTVEVIEPELTIEI